MHPVLVEGYLRINMSEDRDGRVTLVDGTRIIRAEKITRTCWSPYRCSRGRAWTTGPSLGTTPTPSPAATQAVVVDSERVGVGAGMRLIGLARAAGASIDSPRL